MANTMVFADSCCAAINSACMGHILRNQTMSYIITTTQTHYLTRYFDVVYAV